MISPSNSWNGIWPYYLQGLIFIWLVVEPYPSEKYESQLGWFFSIYGKKCSKPPTRYGFKASNFPSQIDQSEISKKKQLESARVVVVEERFSKRKNRLVYILMIWSPIIGISPATSTAAASRTASKQRWHTSSNLAETDLTKKTTTTTMILYQTHTAWFTKKHRFAIGCLRIKFIRLINNYTGHGNSPQTNDWATNMYYSWQHHQPFAMISIQLGWLKFLG